MIAVLGAGGWGTALGVHLVRTGKGAALDAAQLATLCAQVPGTRVHADLTAFADHMIRTERKGRADAGESDSGFGRLD